MKNISFYSLDSTHKSDVYSSGKWVDGDKMLKLKNMLQEYLGVKHVILTNSGTSALLAAYWVLKDKFDTINVDPYTFPATYQSARVLNYKTNFINTQPGKKLLFDNNNLTVITHLYGQPNQFINQLNEKLFIEDACQSFGAEIKGKKVGTFGLFGCFSFYPTKSLHTCGHGGALVTNSDELYLKASTFINCGRVDGKMTETISLNLRMDEIKAEFLIKELKNYDKNIERQIEIAHKYKEVIPESATLFTQCDRNDKHIFSIFNIQVKNRDEFRTFMKNNGIDTLVYYGNDILPKSQKNKYTYITSSIVAIPCRWNLTNKEVNYIVKVLQEWFSS